ncbi:hypothetical protein PG988_003465 [Apiospora saccharicola]
MWIPEELPDIRHLAAHVAHVVINQHVGCRFDPMPSGVKTEMEPTNCVPRLGQLGAIFFNQAAGGLNIVSFFTGQIDICVMMDEDFGEVGQGTGIYVYRRRAGFGTADAKILPKNGVLAKAAQYDEP